MPRQPLHVTYRNALGQRDALHDALGRSINYRSSHPIEAKRRRLDRALAVARADDAKRATLLSDLAHENRLPSPLRFEDRPTTLGTCEPVPGTGGPIEDVGPFHGAVHFDFNDHLAREAARWARNVHGAGDEDWW